MAVPLLLETAMPATAKKPAVKTAKRPAKAKPVNLDKLTEAQLEALPEDVFLASLKPHARRIAKTAFALKGILKKAA